MNTPPHPAGPTNEPSLKKSPGRALPFVLWTLIAIQVLAVCLMAGVPPVCRDSLSHHLAVPKLYVKHGGMVELPDIVFSYYPMNLDLLYAIPLFFGNDILPKYIHFLFALLTAWMIHGCVKRLAGSAYALLAVLWFLSLPIVTVLSISVYVDLGLIFFSTASMVFLLRWMEETGPVRHLIVSGVFCGLALGTKYNALVVFVLLTLMTPVAYIRMSGRDDLTASIRALKYGVVFAASALLVFSPWMVRNWAWKQNPVYPLMKTVFQRPAPAQKQDAGASGAAVVAPQARPTSHLTLRRVVFGESAWETALIPVRVFFQGRDDDPRNFDGRLNPLLFFLPFCAFLPAGRKSGAHATSKKLLLAFAWLFLIITFFRIDMRIRYILPIVPPLVILSALGLRALFETAGNLKQAGFKQAIQAILFCGIGLSLWYNVDYGIRLFHKVDPVSYIIGEVDRDAYIERFRPEYPLYLHINRNLPENAKILGMFIGNRIYYSDRDMISNEPLFRRIVLGSDSPEQVVESLTHRGFSHIMVRHDLFTTWAGHEFDGPRRAVVNALFANRLERLMFKGGVGLYRIVAEGGSGPDQNRSRSRVVGTSNHR